MSMAATTVLGVVGGLVMLMGGHQALQHRMDDRATTSQYTMFLAFMIAPVFQVVNIGTQLTEAVAGLDRTMEILGETRRVRRSGTGARRWARSWATCSSRMCSSRTRRTSRCCTGFQFRVEAGNGDGAGGFVGFGQVDDHQPGLRVSQAGFGARAGGRRGSGDSAAGQLSLAAGRGAAGVVSVRRDDPGERDVLAAGCDGRAVPECVPDCAGG